MFWEQVENRFRDDLRNKGDSCTFRKFTEGILMMGNINTLWQVKNIEVKMFTDIVKRLFDLFALVCSAWCQ